MSLAKRNFFYFRDTVTDISFPSSPQIKLPFEASRIIMVNDSADQVLSWSFQKPNLDGELLCTDSPIVFDGLNEGRVWFKAPADCEYRIWAWRY